MGAITLKNLADGALTGSVVTLYTVPTGTKTKITSVSFCNDTGAVVILLVQLKARTGGTIRTVVQTRAVADKETYLAPEIVGQHLEAGGEILASGSGIDFVISGVEVVE